MNTGSWVFVSTSERKDESTHHDLVGVFMMHRAVLMRGEHVQRGLCSRRWPMHEKHQFPGV
jgi:hypothetical protein